MNSSSQERHAFQSFESTRRASLAAKMEIRKASDLGLAFLFSNQSIDSLVVSTQIEILDFSLLFTALPKVVSKGICLVDYTYGGSQRMYTHVSKWPFIHKDRVYLC